MSDKTERNESNEDISVAFNPLRFYWHVGRQVAGSARPGRYGDLSSDLEKLRKEGIGIIVNLCSEPLIIPEQMAAWFDEVHEPVHDGHPPDREQLERIMGVVREAGASGRRVLVHCRGGIGRTATVLIPLIMELEGLSLDEAVQRLRETGRYTQTMEQWEFLKRWAEEK